MVYSGIYLLPKSSTSTIKSESRNGNNLNATTKANHNNNVSNHLKLNKKLSSTGSTSNRSSESSRFNETSSNMTSSNVTIKSDISKFNKNPKLAPEILFLIKEHAKTLETINQISKKLQEIELKVDDISARLSRDNSLNHSYTKTINNHLQNDHQQINKTINQLKLQQHNHHQAKDQLNQRYTTFKDLDNHHLSNNNLSQNNSTNNATNIPHTNQILSDDSGGEYGNKTNKTVNDEDELLSILDKITKCSHHILQTQQAYQQGNVIYNSLSKSYAYNNNGLISNNNNNNNQFNLQQPQLISQNGLQQQHQLPISHLNNSHNLQSRQYQDFYNSQLQQQHQQNIYPMINPYLFNAKSSIKSNLNQDIQHHQQQQQAILPLKYTTASSMPQQQQQQQTASLNELLFEPNVERFLSNLDQLVCNDDTNLAAILNNSNQATHLINSNHLSMFNHHSQQHQQQFIPISPHHQATSTPISNQSILASTNNNFRPNCLNPNLSPPTNLLNSTASNFNLLNANNVQTLSINQASYLNNNNLKIQSIHNASPQTLQQQQFMNWQKAKELLDKKERERIDTEIKQADEWLGMVDNCINRNRTKYQQSTNKAKQQQASNLMKPDKNEILKKYDDG